MNRKIRVYMCGILGYTSKSKFIDTEVFESALNCLNKRGPNGKGILNFSNFNTCGFFGHTRLSIIDLSNAASQPMSDIDKNISITFNGEIYNFQQIKLDLEKKGVKFKSSSDTEVLIYAYSVWGKELLNKIEGMFSFAILDRNKNKIFLARDHVGEKPLYYYLSYDTFIFSSEIKSIKELATQSLTLDKLSLYKYLFFSYVPSPNTIYHEVKKLQAGHFIEIDLKDFSSFKIEKYWYLENIEADYTLNENKILDQLDYLIDRSVKMRLISDVNVGVFLSGGLDSSIVSYYAAKYNKNVESFSLGYADVKDEINSARYISELLGIKFNLVEFNDSDLKYTKNILEYLDDPIADPAIVPLYYLSKMSSNKATVFLSGDGGDELFGGYQKYKIQYFSKFIIYLNFLSNFAKFSNKKYNKFFENLSVPFHYRQFILGSGGFNISEIPVLKSIFPIDFLDPEQVFEDALKELKLLKSTTDDLNKSLYLDCKFQLPDWYLVKSDRATMAASIELRSPLVDKSLVEFSFKIPGYLKIKNFESKYLLKRLSERYFPLDFVYRKKQGFVVDVPNINKFFNFNLSNFKDDELKKFRIGYIKYFIENNFK